jgi:hypothetical protein
MHRLLLMHIACSQQMSDPGVVMTVLSSQLTYMHAESIDALYGML